MQPAQLTLGLSLQDEATFDSFTIGDNAELVAALKNVAAKEGERFVYLCGSRGVGCSHLLQASCHAAHQNGFRSVYLPLDQLVTTASCEVLSGLESFDLVCLDDVHRVAANNNWEEAVFHLYNQIRDNDGRMVVAAKDLPRNLGLSLPDLESRLSWGVLYQVQPLCDQNKMHVLIARASDRGIRLSEDVAKYIMTHCPRHMTTLFAALDALDKASLAAQRRLTIPFVKEVLQI